MPTWSSSSVARMSAAFLFMPKCVSSASRICRPIVSTGFNDVIGSWKIIAISLPRILRSSLSRSVSRSRPPKSVVPPVTRPARGRMPSSESAVTLLPQPDSPTMPSVSPAATSNEMPLTAWTVPRWVWNSTRRPSTWRRAGELDPATQFGVEGFAEGVADQVEAERRDHDRDAGEDREPRCDLEVLIRARQHRAPLRPRGVLVAEAEEAQAGHVDDCRREGERPLHDHRGDRVRKDVPVQDSEPAHADGPRGEHEVVLALR